jgi:crotonobetainyl-CoA:carnitine CoA-transferase CaiB-like acyl-CoA transferase
VIEVGDRDGALSGVLVADFSRVLAGPMATMNLGDLGAEVVKIERPETGDDTRAWGPPFVGGESTYFLGLNRNKSSISLDFGKSDDLDAARELVCRADVLVENFRPGTMERLGLGYDEISHLNPGLVYCSISAFGSGPEGAKLPGYDFLVQATSGFMSITGEEGGTPLKVGVAAIDVFCGLYATIGILAALEERRESGLGQHVEVSLMDSALSALVNQASGYLLAGAIPEPLGNRHPSIVPYQTFEASDRPFVVATGNEGQWQRLCGALGMGNLAEDERFATNSARIAHAKELEELLGGVFARETAGVWIQRLGEAGVPAGRINDVAEAFEFAEELGLEPIVEIERDGADSTLHLPRSPLRLSRTPAVADRPPPGLGEHSGQILEWLSREQRKTGQG